MRFLSLLELRDYRNQLTKHESKRYLRRSLLDIKKIAVHHGATREGSPEAYANYHVGSLDWPEIAYPLVIGKNGIIYWTMDLNKVSYHVGLHNRYTLGVCLIGDFRFDQPTATQYQSLYRLLEALKIDLSLTDQDVLGHQEFAGYEWKQCPALDMDGLRGQLAAKTYGAVQNNFNNDKKILITRPSVVKLSKEDDGGMANTLFQPSNAAIKKSTENVLVRISNKAAHGDEAIGRNWVDQLNQDKLSESDAVGLLYVALDRELIQGRKDQ